MELGWIQKNLLDVVYCIYNMALHFGTKLIQYVEMQNQQGATYKRLSRYKRANMKNR